MNTKCIIVIIDSLDIKLIHFIWVNEVIDGLRTLDLNDRELEKNYNNIEEKNGKKCCFERSLKESSKKQKSQLMTISEIGEKAFANDMTLQRIIFPRTLKLIEQSAFENCAELQIVEADTENEEPALSIHYRAFKNCQKLHSVIISRKEITVIEAEAFSGCYNLRTVQITGDCNISDSAFEGCDKDKLCFVCTLNSTVEKYAREHGYRYINV